MEYYCVGGRALLNQFPPHLPALVWNYQVNQLVQATLAQQQGGPYPASASSAPPPPADWVSESLGALPAAPASAAGGAAARGGDNSREGRWAPGDGYPHPCDGAPKKAGAWNCEAPAALHSSFCPSEVAAWVPERYELHRKLQDASRNRGQVHLMKDLVEDRLIAVKQMPTLWIQRSHAEFVAAQPTETELPWQDVGCVRFLNSIKYEYACELFGVFRDEVHTYVSMSLATEGDLFNWCEGGHPPGLERVAAVKPVVEQILRGVRQLHDLAIVHRDLSLENVLVTKLAPDDPVPAVRIIDFSMASTKREFRNCVRGKASYQAPELHVPDQAYDGFLSDAFSVGVTMYAVLLKDYPWLSTRPGGCKCFEYVRKNGFRPYASKRKLRNSPSRVAEFLSEPALEVIEGLLALDPKDRLTLGEAAFGTERRSVWGTAWLEESTEIEDPA